MPPLRDVEKLAGLLRLLSVAQHTLPVWWIGKINSWKGRARNGGGDTTWFTTRTSDATKKHEKHVSPPHQKNPQKSFCHSAPGALFSGCCFLLLLRPPTHPPPQQQQQLSLCAALTRSEKRKNSSERGKYYSSDSIRRWGPTLIERRLEV